MRDRQEKETGHEKQREAHYRKSESQRNSEYACRRDSRSDDGKWQLIVVVFFLTVIASGCAISEDAVRQDTQTLVRDTLSNPSEIRTHLVFFNEEGQEGRATGTRGFLKAASYISQRFAGYGLQQAVQPFFRLIYPLPLRDVQRVRMTLYSPDTLNFRSGIDLFPDRASGSGKLRIDSVFVDPEPEAIGPGDIALIPKDLDRDRLNKYVQTGIEALFIKAEPSPAGLEQPSFSIPVVRIAPEVSDRVFPRASSADRGAALLHSVDIDIAIQDRPDGSAVNILALVPGGHPTLRKKLIIVAARLDGYGKMGALLQTDGSDGGLGAAAVLETGRLVAAHRLQGHSLDRSVLFVILSGSMNSHAGLRFLLKYPVWSSSAIETVLYLADAGEDAAAVEDVLAEMGYEGSILYPNATVEPQAEVHSPARAKFVSRGDFFTAAAQDSLSIRAAHLAERALGELFDRGRIGR
jgi:hypothetical protein